MHVTLTLLQRILRNHGATLTIDFFFEHKTPLDGEKQRIEVPSNDVCEPIRSGRCLMHALVAVVLPLFVELPQRCTSRAILQVLFAAIKLITANEVLSDVFSLIHKRESRAGKRRCESLKGSLKFGSMTEEKRP